MAAPRAEPSPAVAAVMYCAKSTEDSHGSIPTQLADCRAAAEAEGRTVVAEYHDEAASAFTGDRGPGLRDALEHVERLDRGAELWVQHPDRLARGDGLEAAHLIEYVLRARKAGFQLRAVQHDDSFHDLIRAVLTGERNHEDSARKAAATQAGKRRAAERGEWVGSIVADGYRILRSLDERGNVTRKAELNPERADIYRLHFELALAGYSDRAIVLALDEHGYRTQPHKATHRPRPFDASRVRQTLANPVYAGLAVYRGEIVGEGDWPALVSPEDFDAIRAARALRSHHEARETGRPPEGYALARVATCGACGAPMDVVTGRHHRKDATRKRSYVCRTHRERPQDCDAAPIDGEVVDRAFVANLDTFLGDVEGWRERLVADANAGRQRMADEVARAHADISKCSRVLAAGQRRYASALADDDDDAADAIQAALVEQHRDHGRAETRLAAATAAHAEIAAAVVDIDPLLEFFWQLREELRGRKLGAGGDVKRLNLVVRDYFERVLLTTIAVPGVGRGHVPGPMLKIRGILGEATSTRLMADRERGGWIYPSDPGLSWWPPPTRTIQADELARLLKETDGNAPPPS